MVIFLALLISLGSGSDPKNKELTPGVQNFLSTYSSQRLFADDILYNHYYASPDLYDAAIVFLPGMGEPGIKYYDLPRDLHKKASFYLWDHIGQGLSFHFVPLEREKVHIDTFETYTQTLTPFLAELRKKHKKIIVIAHSMGGHIALKISLAHPELIDQLILSSPMISINTSWIPINFLSWIANFLPSDFYPPFYALFKKSSAGKNYTTTSEERMAVYQNTLRHFPAIKRAGPTLGWLKAAQNSIRKLSKTSWQQYKKPLLLLQAEEDYLVSNFAEDEICSRIPTCQMVKIKNSRHEILFEVDTARTPALTAIRNALQELPDAP